MKEKTICLVSEDKEQTVIKKLIPLVQLIDDNYRLETKVYDTDNQIWYKISISKV
jgi:hypothetical protein